MAGEEDAYYHQGNANLFHMASLLSQRGQARPIAKAPAPATISAIPAQTKLLRMEYSSLVRGICSPGSVGLYHKGYDFPGMMGGGSACPHCVWTCSGPLP